MSKQPKELYHTILKQAEIKRVAERVTKKELCNLYKLNYNFYMNCVSSRNIPSERMIDSLVEYLNTPTIDVYEKVFATREKETGFHEKLDISEDEATEFIEKLEQKGIYQEPHM